MNNLTQLRGSRSNNQPKTGRRALRNLFGAACLTAFSAFANHAAADADYEDWWLCANECAPDDAACVDKCTEEYNSSHEPSTRPLKLKLAPAHKPVMQTLINRCPKGTHLAPFDMPIYDRNGVFVVGYKTVWMCLPDDLEPAG